MGRAVIWGVTDTWFAAARDDRLPANCVRVAAAHPLTIGLGTAAVTLERIEAQQKVAV